MKSRTLSIIIVLMFFVLSMLLVSWGFTKIIFYPSETKDILTKASITETDVFLNIFGKKIPEGKMNLVEQILGNNYDNDNIKNDSILNILEFCLIIILPSLIITLALSAVFFTIKNAIKIKKESRRKAAEDNILKDKYFMKYPLGQNPIKVKCLDSVQYVGKLKNKNLIAWFENNKVFMINSDYREDIGKYIIDFSDIVCFSRYGDFYTSINVNGGGTSYSRAALGYVIAGGVGAVVASRDPIRSSTKVHDERETLLVFRYNDSEGYLFFGPKFHKLLMHFMPNKEISHIAAHITKREGVDDKYNKLIKLSELREKGHISEDEFSQLKKELIS